MSADLLILLIFPWKKKVLKFNNKDSRSAENVFRKLTIKALEWRHWDLLKIYLLLNQNLFLTVFDLFLLTLRLLFWLVKNLVDWLRKRQIFEMNWK